MAVVYQFASLMDALIWCINAIRENGSLVYCLWQFKGTYEWHGRLNMKSIEEELYSREQELNGFLIVNVDVADAFEALYRKRMVKGGEFGSG